MSLPTIALLVTGKTELLGLADSLRRIFPADFRYVNNPNVDPEQHLRGFTSGDVRQLLGVPLKMGSNLEWFVEHLVAEAYPGRTGKPPDLVVGVDDLELYNIGHPDIVVQVLRDAVRLHVERSFSGPTRERVYERLRGRCSFHLLKPMVETYFFGEPAALDRAGRASNRVSRFDRDACDPEDFQVEDPTYMAILEPPTTESRRKSVRRKDKQDWRRSQERRPYHPKKYVQFLCDALGDGDTTYSEASGGASALRSLAWEMVLCRPDQVPFIRALLVDIARMVPPRQEFAELITIEPRCATWPPPRDMTLRNV
jgi:hypothetical protein